MQTEVITNAIEQSIKWATLFQWGGLIFLGIVAGLFVWARRKKDLAEQQFARSSVERNGISEKSMERKSSAEQNLGSNQQDET